MIRLPLGYRKDKRDSRDWLMGSWGTSPLDIPSDLTPFILGRFDQLKTSTCVTNAIDAGWCIRQVQQGLPWTPFSRLFPYYYGRSVLMRMVDMGSRPRDVLKALSVMGAPPEEEWPFEQRNVNKRPPAEKRRLAVDLRFRYRRCLDIDAVARALGEGMPVALGMQIDEAFSESSGADVITTFQQKRVGGHMVLIVANDPVNRRMLVLNSWGRNWRINGLVWLSYDLIRREAIDLWAID